MKEFLNSFSPREWAVIIWLIPILIWILRRAEIRASLKSMLETILSPKILVPFLILTFYVTVVVWGLKCAGVWSLSVLKDTIFWFFGTFIVAVFGSSKADEDPAVFKKLVLKALAFSIVFQFIASEYTFSLPWELILVPVATVIGLMGVVAEYDPKLKAFAKGCNTVLMFLGTLVVAWAIAGAIHDKSFLTLKTALKFGLAPALTTLSIPALAMFAAYLAYENRFLLIREFHLKDHPKLARFACWQLVFQCGLSFSKLNRTRGGFYVSLSEATSKGEVRNCVRDWSRGQGKLPWETEQAATPASLQ